jgi:hypothetical protein
MHKPTNIHETAPEAAGCGRMRDSKQKSVHIQIMDSCCKIKDSQFEPIHKISFLKNPLFSQLAE